MGIASLVMGILSMTCCCGPLTGIPAIICGIICLKSKEPSERTFGIVGIITGALGSVLFICGFGMGIIQGVVEEIAQGGGY